MNYFEFHIGDYDKATAHLSACEDGIYGRLMRRYYDTEQPLTPDIKALQRFVRARTKDELQAVEVVLAEFFVLEADGWHHKRCDAEINRYRVKSEKARESVSKRWAKRDANALQTDNEEPTNDIRNGYERNTDDIHRAPVPSNQKPVTSIASYPDAYGGSAQSADPKAPPAIEAIPSPPTPPPAFDGRNAEVLNGKSIVPIAPAFELPDSWGFDAEALGFKPPEVLREAERFRQYWTAGKGLGTRRSVKGWRQSWSNWLAKASETRR